VASLPPRAGHSDRRRAELSQFQDNLASFELTLSSDQLKTLDEASVIELGFPYEMYAKAMPRAVCYGGLRDQILA